MVTISIQFFYKRELLSAGFHSAVIKVRLPSRFVCFLLESLSGQSVMLGFGGICALTATYLLDIEYH